MPQAQAGGPVVHDTGSGRARPDRSHRAALQQFLAGWPDVEPLAVLLCRLSGGIALGEQLIERVAAARLWLNNQTAAVDDQADGIPGLQMQHVKNRWGNGEHNRTPDLPQIGRVQSVPPGLYMCITDHHRTLQSSTAGAGRRLASTPLTVNRM